MGVLEKRTISSRSGDRIMYCGAQYVLLKMETVACHSSGGQNFEVAPKLLDKFCFPFPTILSIGGWMGLWIVRTTVTGKSTQRCVDLPPFPIVYQISSKSVEWLGRLGCTWRHMIYWPVLFLWWGGGHFFRQTYKKLYYHYSINILCNLSYGIRYRNGIFSYLGYHSCQFVS